MLAPALARFALILRSLVKPGRAQLDHFMLVGLDLLTWSRFAEKRPTPLNLAVALPRRHWRSKIEGGHAKRGVGRKRTSVASPQLG